MTAMERVVYLDLVICQRVNRACAYRAVRGLFAFISWLGDGKIWYGLMLALVLTGSLKAMAVSLQMAICGLVGVLVYKVVKHATHRPRPYVAHGSIMLGAAPLDQFSFPSGHTLHAVMFSIIVASAFPAAAWILLPFTGLIAASRVILGLHYPTDVLLGAAIGAGIAFGMPGQVAEAILLNIF